MMQRATMAVAVAAAALAGMAAAYFVTREPARPALERATLFDAGRPLAEPGLVDHLGRDFGLDRLRGRWTLLFFGYTFCPDVCPTTTLDMSQALDALGPAAAQIQPVFITVDPARDTPDELKKFLANFHPSFVGLTGTEAEIQAVAKAYRVYFARAKGAERDYLMDHTSIVYLMDRDGKFLTHFSMKVRGPEMAEAIKKFL